MGVLVKNASVSDEGEYKGESESELVANRRGRVCR